MTARRSSTSASGKAAISGPDLLPSKSWRRARTIRAGRRSLSTRTALAGVSRRIHSHNAGSPGAHVVSCAVRPARSEM